MRDEFGTIIAIAREESMVPSSNIGNVRDPFLCAAVEIVFMLQLRFE